MKPLAAILAIAIAACAPKAVPVPDTYRPGAPVPVAQDAAPRVSELRDAHSKADEQGAVVDANADRIGTQAGTLAAGMRQIQAEADRLRKQEAASKKELDDLWQALVTETMRAIELHEESDRLRGALATERDLRRKTYARIEPLELAVREGNQERLQLRMQLADAEKAAVAYSAQVQSQHKAYLDAKATADTLKGKVSVWRNIALVCGSIALAAILIIIFRPRFL